jgi:hypothetical protein
MDVGMQLHGGDVVERAQFFEHAESELQMQIRGLLRSKGRTEPSLHPARDWRFGEQDDDGTHLQIVN